jgi:proteasome-associated ATPase
MSENEQGWKEKALEAIAILKKVSQPPLVYATITGFNDQTADVSLTNGTSYVVNFDPRLRNQLGLGKTARLSPETMAIVGIEGKIQTTSASVVREVLPDGRVKVEYTGGVDRVVQTSVPVKAGDKILVDVGFNVVLESFGKEASAYHVDKVPEVPWSAIGGLEATIEDIKTTIELPFTHRDLYAKFPHKKLAKGILLYGPPGCGKTMLGKGIAYNLALRKKQRDGGELNGYFLYAAGPEFLQKYVGTGEEKVREMFGCARETAAKNGDPVVIFIDEPEAVLRNRGSGISSDAPDSIVNQFLVEMDGLKPLDNIVVLFATNRPEMLDSALIRPGRVDRKIYVPRPDQGGAEKIFEIYLKDVELSKPRLFSGGADKIRAEYAKYAAQEVFSPERAILQITYQDGQCQNLNYGNIFSGASAVSIVGRATDYALKRAIEGGDHRLTKDDLVAAVDSEYRENRALHNLVSKEDVKAVAGQRFQQIARVHPLYAN